LLSPFIDCGYKHGDRFADPPSSIDSAKGCHLCVRGITGLKKFGVITSGEPIPANSKHVTPSTENKRAKWRF